MRSSRITRWTVTLFCVGAMLSVAQAQTSTDAPEQSKFLRFVTDKDGGGSLQASVVRYENDQGVTVDLVAAVHIADRSFFRALDSSFEDYDAVLYELVASKEMLGPTTQGAGLRTMRPRDDHEPPTTAASKRRGGGSMAWVGTLQRFLRDTLKLTFQLEEVDYKRPNFIHADLDAETFAQMQEERGESFSGMLIQSMLREMSRGDAGNQPGLGDLLFAMQSPDKARQLKLLFAKQFNKIDDQMAGMEGPKGSVLLTERNKAAMRTLKKAMASGKRSVAIFYGAGHLKGMDKMLTDELGFHQVGPPFWRVAWDMTAAPTTQPATK
ncbi:hypothetical protein BH09PLA1_BH09PLA1_34370 [soil metagenome]